MLNSQIIDQLPLAYSGQPNFLKSELGQQMIFDIFDDFGYRGDLFNCRTIAEGLSLKYGAAIRTRESKVQAALRYLEAEGKLTGDPQIFRVAGKYSFQKI